jgi:hypothetical protein
MACAEVRPLISALHDGELSPDEATLVRAHVSGCEACRAFQREVAGASQLVARHAPRLVFDEVSLARFERALAREGRWEWRGFLAAASFAAIAWSLSALVVVSGPMVVSAFTRSVLPVLPYADPRPIAGNLPACPPGLEGVADASAARTLTVKQREALESSGLVQVPGDGTDLATFYGGDSALVTADAALLVYQGAVARAVHETERERIAPALRETLEHLLRGLRAVEREAPNADLEHAARLARRIIQVAAELDGLPAGGDEAVARDVAAARRAEGRSESAVLGRELAWTRFELRGALASLPEHFRAVVWLGEAALRLDREHPDELRAASLVALSLARERTDLARFADLDDTASLIHGPQDDLGALDVLSALRSSFGSAIRPEVVGRPEALEPIARHAAAIAASSRTGAIATLDEPGVRFRLVGNTRSLESLVVSSLSGDALPRRARPTSLDLLAAMGSSAARAVASSDGAEGYSRALDGLTSILGEVTQVPRAVARSGSGVERSRLFALASLLPRPDAAAPSFMATQAYSDRLLLAAFAGLNATDPGPADGELTTDPRAALPAIEPLPAFYARLAHGARRLALGLETVSGGRATARLRRTSELLSGLSLAAEETLARRELSEESRWALRAFASAARVLAPANPWSVETVHVQLRRDGAREWLDRSSGPLDRLYLVLPDARGELRLACGPVLAARETVATHPLTPAEAARAPRVDPEWASHIVR